jgi:hypothetical protein
MSAISTSYRTYFTVAREMGPNDFYVDNRESRHYPCISQAEKDAEFRNENFMPDNAVSKFFAVEVTRSVVIKRV